MRKFSTVAISAILLPGVLALAACSASSTPKSAASAAAGSTASAAPTAAATTAAESNTDLTSAEVNSQIAAAVKTATAVHVKGSMGSGGSSVTLDLQLNKDSGQGTITAGGLVVPFVSVDNAVYIQFTPSLLAQAGQSSTSTVGKELLNKWVSSTSTMGSSIASDFGPFMSLSAFAAQVTSDDSTFTADGTSTVNGVPVVNFKTTDDSSTPPDVSIISIPATGPALPVQVSSGSDGTEGTTTFTWNQPTTGITAPPASQIFTG